MSVLETVLCKVHGALRTNGLLYIAQPSPVDATVEVVLGDKVLFTDELPKPNFNVRLQTTEDAIAEIVDKGLFQIKQENTHSSTLVYESVDEWLSYYLVYTEDPEELQAMAARARGYFVDGESRVKLIANYYEVLLVKVG